jgi:hypothetical protein
MATSAVYGDKVKISDTQSLQQSTPPGFGQYWNYGKDESGNTIFKYINPDSPKMTWAYDSKNQLVQKPDIGWDGQPWTNRKWLSEINGFAISPDGRSMTSTVPPGQTNVSGVDSSQKYTINGSGLSTTVNFSYSNQWGSGSSSAGLLNIADVAPDKQGEYLSGLTKYATGEYLPVKQYVTQTGNALGDFLASIDPSTAVSRELTKVVQPVEKAVTTAASDVSKALSTDDAKKAMAIAAAYYLPGVGSAIGQSLISSGVIAGAAVPYATAIGTAIASTASQVAQGVPLEQALGNATTSAVVSTGAPSVAQDINALVKSPAVADAITSAGASALKTAVAGGSAEDIQRNMTSALAGSTASSLYTEAAQAETAATGRTIGAAVGGAVAGGAMGAATGVASELGRPETTPTRPPQLAEADTGTVSDVPTLTETLVTATPEAPGIGDTSIITPETTISPKDKAVIEATGIGAAPSLPQVTVTATPEPPPIEETSIVTPDVSVTKKEDTSAKPVTEEEKLSTEEEPAPEEPYKPELFIYGGTAPKPKTRTTTDLGTTLQAPFYPSTTLGQALTGYRGAGEIEGKKSGKPRRNVWNEESLRLKDALGL